MRSVLLALACALCALGCDDTDDDPTADAATPDLGDECQPSDERCDGRDNDCDGTTDEGFDGIGEPCGDGAGGGACAADGVQVCADDGLSVVCRTAGGAEPGDETCNGADDDCDGTVDEDIESAGCDTGEPGPCGAGRSSCVDGVTVCVPDGAPTAEACDGVDNDCDGTTDEGDDGAPLTEPCYSGPDGTEGIGLCGTGTRSCEGGMPGRCVGQRTPVEEFCDAFDNDCDGIVDEDYALGAACTVGEGACVAEGVVICDPADGETACSAAPGAPGVEVCNDIDDDCDGIVDDVEGLGDPCRVGQGQCMAVGEYICGVDALLCEGAEGSPRDELCNALDDDCDGRVDEDFDVGSPCVIGEGACRVDGRLQCANDGIACVGDPLPPAPVEYCDDGIDDDCDGEIDEAGCSVRCVADADCGGAACIDGLCGAAEICDDGLDNDSDGVIDCLDADCAAFEGCGPCGNGVLDEGEACDDGGRAVGDGCDGDCQVEGGFVCAPPGLALCAAGEAPVSYAATGDPVLLDPLGGEGGEPYDDPCPAGEVIVGFDAHVGAEWQFSGGAVHVQRLRAQCARIDLDGDALALTPTAATPGRGGVAGSGVPDGYTDQLRCAPGEAVTGLTLYRGAEYVNGVAFTCSTLALREGAVTFGDPVERGSAGLIDVEIGGVQCPDDAAAIAHIGRGGHVLDQVTMRCARPEPRCAVPSVCQIDRACRYAFDGGALDPFVSDDPQPWTLDAGAATSGAIDHDQQSTMRLAVSTPAGGRVAFQRRVSSEQDFDFLRFIVDGVERTRWSGEVPFGEAAFDLAAGDHVLEWAYTKDGSVSAGQDRAQVDDVVLDGAAELCDPR